MASFSTTRRVEFRDTDAAGIAHFTSLIGYMEEAEHAFLRHAGLSVVMRDSISEISWPRVSVQSSFAAAVAFEQVVEINVRIARLGQKSVTYAFSLTSQNEAVAEGSLTSVCCRIVSGKPPQSIVIPDWIREKLKPWSAA